MTFLSAIAGGGAGRSVAALAGHQLYAQAAASTGSRLMQYLRLDRVPANESASTTRYLTCTSIEAGYDCNMSLFRREANGIGTFNVGGIPLSTSIIQLAMVRVEEVRVAA
jgi:hypothetical protein